MNESDLVVSCVYDVYYHWDYFHNERQNIPNGRPKKKYRKYISDHESNTLPITFSHRILVLAGMTKQWFCCLKLLLRLSNA